MTKKEHIDKLVKKAGVFIIPDDHYDFLTIKGMLSINGLELTAHGEEIFIDGNKNFRDNEEILEEIAEESQSVLASIRHELETLQSFFTSTDYID